MSYTLECRNSAFDLDRRTHIMGILNVTPDSFFDGGNFDTADKALKRAEQMIEEGADFIDVGGESTRPGAEQVSASEELQRVIPVIERIRQISEIPISIDTTKSAVAREALNAGADIINDISGLTFDRDMARVAADFGVTVIIMHMQGSPATMQDNPHYNDIIAEIHDFFKARIEAAIGSGIQKNNIVIDPGIGFGKKRPDNFLILNKLNAFFDLNCPILIGPSRKSFIGWAMGDKDSDRLMGTAAAVAASIMNGAHIVRVHDVRAMKDVAVICDLVLNEGMPRK